jgi:hypothetical protein
MGIKQWFGESLVSLIQSAQVKQNQQMKEQMHHTVGMESMFGSATPAVVAFRISNGYVVRTVDSQADMVGMRQGGFHYCKDHQEIAEHIVAVEAKRKLGIGDEYQQEMFAAEKSRAVAMQGGFAQSKRATNRI